MTSLTESLRGVRETLEQAKFYSNASTVRNLVSTASYELTLIITALEQPTNDIVKYLRELSDKLMAIPVMYGTDQSDVDELLSIANKLENRAEQGQPTNDVREQAAETLRLLGLSVPKPCTPEMLTAIGIRSTQPTNDVERVREAFEIYTPKVFLCRRANGDYKLSETQADWIKWKSAWQAALTQKHEDL